MLGTTYEKSVALNKCLYLYGSHQISLQLDLADCKFI